MSQIISHTPIWVFVVFFTLLILGYVQTKERNIKVRSVFILPIAMIIFSFFGVYSVFGVTTLTMSLWIIGLVITFILGVKLAYPKLVLFSKPDNKLMVPGSWAPLFFMMAIFFTKYFVGFAAARELPLIKEILFIVSISMLYGMFSGVFLSRSFIIFKASKVSA